MLHKPTVLDPLDTKNRKPRAGTFARGLLTILIIATAWRVAIASAMPVISRDGVRFCWMARDLGERGWALLREPDTEQHPLYPALILAAQRAALALGQADSPILWQRCGQAVALASGLAVIVLTALMARTLARRVELEEHADLIGLLAAATAGLLPLNVWLSADVMSDELHLALYLAGVWCMMELPGVRRALLCGMFAGLAFLTRPEGAGVLVGGLAVIASGLRHRRFGRSIGAGVAMMVGFSACATPLWWVTGKFSPKKDVGEVLSAAGEVWIGRGRILDFGFWILDWGASGRERSPEELAGKGVDLRIAGKDSGESGNEKGFSFQRSSFQQSSFQRFSFQRFSLPPYPLPRVLREEVEPARAVLIERPTSWYMLAPVGLYETLRAGRIVIPVLAAIALWLLRKRLKQAPLLGVITCICVHFTLLMVLLHKWHYLSPRHALVIAGLLTPMAAIAVCRICCALAAWVEGRGRIDARLPGLLAVVMLMSPLAVYSLRIPNGIETFLRDAARWLIENDSASRGRLMLSGSSPRRVAFYAGMRHQAWPENEGSYNALAEHVLHFKPQYFAMEDGPGRERAGNAELMKRLGEDKRIAPFCLTIQRFATPRGDALVLYVFAWPDD